MIIFYNPQSSASAKPILPMSLMAVAAALNGRYSYTIIDGNLEKDALSTLNTQIAQAGDDPILAVTVMPGPQLQQAVPLCQTLKQNHPQLTIIWGGYFPTQHWDACLRSDFVDYVARGHSELAFAKLIDLLMGESIPLSLAGDLNSGSQDDLQSALQHIAGLAYRDVNGEPYTNPLAPIPHPKQLPAWDYDKIPTEKYIRNTFLGSRTLSYHSSYGCPFFCSFCAVVNMVNGRWLPASAESVADVARMYNEKWGINAIEFYDNNFFTHEARVAEFSEQIMDLNMAWWGEGRIDTMQNYSTRTWELMRDSGLKMVFLGAESGSMETLKRMDKGGQMSPDKTLEMVRLMKEYNIVPELSFVMGNPPHPEKDAHDTMEFIRKVKTINPAAEIIMYLYTPVPSESDLYADAVSEGFAFPQTLEEWVSPAWENFSQRRSVSLPWIKRPLHQQLHDFERVLNAYYPTTTNTTLTPLARKVLRAASAWRYNTRIYRSPIELRALHKLIAYQRPETSGF